MAWRPISKEEYIIKVDGLKPVESFSDPTGESHLGKGFPWMETIWGVDDKRLLKSITSKVNVDQEKWDEHYFENMNK
jgi:hypothetical protein